MYEQRVRALFDVPSPRPVPPSPKTNAALSTQLAPRSSRRAYEDAKLETPFDHRRSEYHTSQQDALNAQLRLATEKQVGEWERTIRSTRTHVEQLLTKVNPSNRVTLNQITAYQEGYRCTADLMITEDSICAEEEDKQQLRMTMDRLRHLQGLPRINSAEVGVTLDRLLHNTSLLNPLLPAVDSLKPVDFLSGLDVAVCGAALHEKLHYNPLLAAKEQLQATDDQIHDLEQNAFSTKAEKEGAVIAKDMSRAGSALTRHVNYGNDLLVVNERRMKMIALAEVDVTDYSAECRNISDVAQDVAAKLAGKLTSIMQPIRQDLETTETKKKDLQTKKEQDAADHHKGCLEARHQWFELDMQEHKLWTEILAMVERAENLMSDKKRFAFNRLVTEEKFSRQQLHDADTIKAYEDHISRLSLCEELVSIGLRTAHQFDAFVATMDATLKNKLSKLSDEVSSLKLTEAAAYCRRYEMFAFATEECRVTNESRLDSLKRDQRTATIDLEHATSILDPDAPKYRQKIEEASTAGKDISMLISLTNEIHAARTSEVQPWISYVAATLTKEQLHIKKRSHDEPQKLIAGGGGGGAIEGRAAAKEDRVSSTALVPSMDAELAAAAGHHMPHPKVSAMEYGISYEDKRAGMINEFVRQEQSAIEGRMSEIRKQKNELARK